MTIWIEAPFDSLPIEGYRKQRYWMMAEAFVRAGHAVVYWTSDFSHARKKRREQGTGNGEQGMGPFGFELVMVPTRSYPKNVCLKRILSHRAYAREWERMAVEAVEGGMLRPDMIVVSSPPVSTGPVAMRLARRFGAKLVVDIQDAWPETFYRLAPRGLRWAVRLLLSGMRRTVGETYRAADLVTGVCDRYEALAKGYGAKDYYRAYLGIEEVRGRRSEVRGQRSEGVRLVYVGNLGKSYDLETVVKGVALLNRQGIRATLDVAGFGGGIETSETVRFHGMLQKDALGRLLSGCDIGVIPMKADSFVGIPNKLGEYAASGLAVVSSLRGETADLLARYRCGETYRAGDAESFAETVGRVRRLPADEGARRLAEELSAERIYDAYCREVCVR